MAKNPKDNMAFENEMEQRVPTTPSPNPMASQDSRTLVRAHASAAARKNLTQVMYEGRKRRSGAVAPARGEHVDLIVPEEGDNEVAVEDFMAGANPNNMSDEQRKSLANYGPDTVHLIGQHYHFVGGEVSEVYTDHLPFLLDHPAYKFSEVNK